MLSRHHAGALALAILCCLTVFASPAWASAEQTTRTAGVTSLAQMMLNNYSGANSVPSSRYYADGYWYTADTPGANWTYTQGGPALASATLWVAGGRTDDALLQRSVATIDRTLAGQHANGSFGPGAGDGIATMFSGRFLGGTYLTLSPYLTPARRVAWANALARAADYLVRNGDSVWYANGNVNLGYADLFYMAYRATGESRFLSAYDAEMDFVVSPPARWADRGFGLKYTRQPSNADGSDGAGYLAESGGGGTGFDAEYTMIQLNAAVDIYVISGDARALRLANLLVNQLLPRITPSPYPMLDTSRGTRHTETSRSVPFVSAAFAVLGTRGGRNDLAALSPAYVPAITNYMRIAVTWSSNPVFYLYLGLDITQIIRSDLNLLAVDCTVTTPAPPAQASQAPPAANPPAPASTALLSRPTTAAKPTAAATRTASGSKASRSMRAASARRSKPKRATSRTVCKPAARVKTKRPARKRSTKRPRR